jgi:hypothetical protein
VKVLLLPWRLMTGVTTPDRDTCKSDLLACAESPDRWVDDLGVETRQWAADLPMEGLLFALRSYREPLRLAGADFAQRTVVRSVLLSLACKDPDMLEDLADEFRSLLPAGLTSSAQPATSRSFLAA